jgi:hypothetical protein
MAAPVIQSGQIKTGPGVIRYAPPGTALPAPTAAGSKLVPAFAAAWLEVGATDAGLTYSESTDTTDVPVAESLYPIRTVTTGKTGTVSFAMSHISDVNWKLANNGGTLTTTGTGATKMSVYVPPLVGQEVRVMLAFFSLDEDELIVWPQVFNTGGFETSRAGFADKHLLPVGFSVELPDPAILTTPYKRWTAGALSQAV